MVHYCLTAITLLPFIGVVGLVIPLLLSGFSEKTVLLAGKSYPLAPSIVQMTHAARLNDQWMRNLQCATACFVLGGQNSNPTDKTATLPCLPFDYNQPNLPDLSPLHTIRNSFDFYHKLSASHADIFEAREGFSAICLGANHIEAILHLRVQRTDEYVFYDIVLYYGSHLNEMAFYSYCLKKDEALWDLPPGAVHYWQNQDTASGVCLVLPDPYLLPGATKQTFSRFTYFEPLFR